MNAYNKTLLEQTFLLEEAQNLRAGGFINTDQFRIIESQLPVLKTQKSFLIRIGLFLVGLVLCASIAGVLTLFSYSMMSMHGVGWMAFLFSLICIGGLEWMIQTKNYFGYGLDDAFLLSGQLALAVCLYILLDEMDLSQNWLDWLFILGFGAVMAFCAIRYLNLLSALGACIALTAVVGYWFVEKNIGITPFIIMLFAALLGLGFTLLRKRFANPIYTHIIQLVIYYSYVLFYLSGNLLALSYFSYHFYSFDWDIAEVYMGFLDYFYWFFSFLVPIIYLFYAVKTKDKGWLWIGGLCLFFSFYTLMCFSNFLTTDWWLTLGGAVLFGLSLGLIKRLKYKTTGLTFEPDLLNDDSSFMDAEALIVAAQLGLKPEATQEAPMKFGGGGFSGGGAGDTF
ncbi:hypothetical protein [Flavobacterium sp. NKUCC04_CG]|uniref:hypothetical protein n=1 Tax=Flavobacterium sp. NKUCC04_CG TaxID=2842121 RepID=UPI001C5AD17A|nr:hypothetical protein [Flavobacterium sp. NKUCC04_CG]MBW3518308.1 hypothetical protein [Flavobacterium sp. NKUCC04_CG]